MASLLSVTWMQVVRSTTLGRSIFRSAGACSIHNNSLGGPAGESLNVAIAMNNNHAHDGWYKALANNRYV